MKIRTALISGTLIALAYGGLLGYLNGSPPPPAWPPSVALLDWPADSWVALLIPVATVYAILLAVSLIRRRPR